MNRTKKPPRGLSSRGSTTSSTSGRPNSSSGRSRQSVRTAQSSRSVHSSKTAPIRASTHATSATMRQRYTPPQVSLHQFDASGFDVVDFLDGLLPLESLLPGNATSIAAEQENKDDDFAILDRLDLSTAATVLADGLRAIDRLQDEIEYEVGLTNAANETMTAELADLAEKQITDHQDAVAQLAKLEDRCSHISPQVLDSGHVVEVASKHCARVAHAQDLLMYYHDFATHATSSFPVFTEFPLYLTQAAPLICQLHRVAVHMRHAPGAEQARERIEAMKGTVLNGLLDAFDSHSSRGDREAMKEIADTIVIHYKEMRGASLLLGRFVFNSLAPLVGANRSAGAYKLAAMQENLALFFRQLRSVVRGQFETVLGVFPQHQDEVMGLLLERLFNDTAHGLLPVLEFFLKPPHRTLPEHEYLEVLSQAYALTKGLAQELVAGLGRTASTTRSLRQTGTEEREELDGRNTRYSSSTSTRPVRGGGNSRQIANVAVVDAGRRAHLIATSSSAAGDEPATPLSPSLVSAESRINRRKSFANGTSKLAAGSISGIASRVLSLQANNTSSKSGSGSAYASTTSINIRGTKNDNGVISFHPTFVHKQLYSVFHPFTVDYVDREVGLFRARCSKAMFTSLPVKLVADANPKLALPHGTTLPETPISNSNADRKQRAYEQQERQVPVGSLEGLPLDAQNVLRALRASNTTTQSSLPSQVIAWAKEAHLRMAGILEPPTLSLNALNITNNTGNNSSNGAENESEKEQYRVTIGANSADIRELSSLSAFEDYNNTNEGEGGQPPALNDALSAAVEELFETLCALVIPGIIQPCLSALTDLLPPVVPVSTSDIAGGSSAAATSFRGGGDVRLVDATIELDILAGEIPYFALNNASVKRALAELVAVGTTKSAISVVKKGGLLSPRKAHLNAAEQGVGVERVGALDDMSELTLSKRTDAASSVSAQVVVVLAAMQAAREVARELVGHWKTNVAPTLKHDPNAETRCQDNLAGVLTDLDNALNVSMTRVLAHVSASLQASFLALQRQSDYNPNALDPHSQNDEASFPGNQPTSSGVRDDATVACQTMLRLARGYFNVAQVYLIGQSRKLLESRAFLCSRDVLLASLRVSRVSRDGAFAVKADVAAFAEAMRGTCRTYPELERSVDELKYLPPLFMVMSEHVAVMAKPECVGDVTTVRLCEDCISLRAD